MSLYNKLVTDLKKLELIDSNKKIFGSKDHMYKLNPTLSENQISEFEKKYGVTLPLDFRLFLKEIGNGGAGPSFGIPQLESFFSSREYDIEIESDFLSTSFPYSVNNPYVYSDETDESLIKEMTGTLTLCHHGCGYFDMLILTGDEKGTVWFDSRCSDQGMGRIFDCFLDWYFYWLKKSIDEIESYYNCREFFDCKVVNISGKGYVRNLAISIKETSFNTYYIEHNEFLNHGETTNLIQRNQEVKITFVMEDLKGIEKTSLHTVFKQPIKDSAYTEASATVINSFNEKNVFFYQCYVETIKRNILIKSYKEYSLSKNDFILLKGILSVEFY